MQQESSLENVRGLDPGGAVCVTKYTRHHESEGPLTINKVGPANS